MRKAILSILLPTLAWAATRTVCASGCDHAATIAGLQAAHDAAACGDEIVVTAGTVITAANTERLIVTQTCSAGSEWLVRSSTAADWLPGPDQRILPAFAPLMWRITTGAGNRNNEPLIDMRAAGVAGVTFRDLRVHIGTGTTFQSHIVSAGPWWPGPTGSTQLSDRIRFERFMYSSDFESTISTKSLFFLSTKRFDVRDSYGTDIGCYDATASNECYVTLMSNNSAGPYFARNNYWAGAPAIFTLSGGSGDHSFPLEEMQPNGFEIVHNVHTVWARYAASAIGQPGRMIKNCDERKVGNDTLFAWNTCEGFDRFSPQAQSFGGTYTVRQQGNPLQGTASLDGPKTTISINITTVSNTKPMVGYWAGFCTRGAGLCVPNYAETGWEFRKITGITGCTGTGSCTITVASAFSAATDGNNQAAVVAMPWASVHRVSFLNNVIRNTGNLFTSLGRDEIGINPTFPDGRLMGFRVENNLLEITRNPQQNGVPGIFGQLKMRTNGFSGRKNAVHLGAAVNSWPWGGAFYTECRSDFLADSADWCEGTRIEGNIIPSGQFASAIASQAYTPQNTMNLRHDTGLVYRWNFLHAPAGSGYSQPPRSTVESCTGGRTCAGNFFVGDPVGLAVESYVSASNGDYRVRQAALRGVMDDGTDVGLDVSLLPLISYVVVSPSTTSATIRYNVPHFWADRACSVEVAAAGTGLLDDSANFSILNAQRADWFKRAPYDLEQVARGWVTVVGRRRNYTVGSAAASVTDDNSTSRDIRLTSGTAYDYRILCGGAVHRGTFTTL